MCGKENQPPPDLQNHEPRLEVLRVGAGQRLAQPSLPPREGLLFLLLFFLLSPALLRRHLTAVNVAVGDCCPFACRGRVL